MQVKTYTSAGVYICTISPDIILTMPSWSANINAWLGELTITISDLDRANEWEIIKITDIHMWSERVLYTWEITRSTHNYDRSGWKTKEVRALGYYASFSDVLYKSAGNYEFTKSGNLSDLIGDVVDVYLAAYPGRLTKNISTNTTSVTQEFSGVSCQTALSTFRKFSDFAFFIRADSVFEYFDLTSATIHKLTLGKHIADMKLEYTIEKIINSHTVRYWVGVWDQVTATDSSSVSQYWLHETYERNITNITTATNLANAKIAKNKSQRASVRIIVTNSYDYYSILPGHLIQVRNYFDGIDMYNVARIDYGQYEATIRLDLYEGINSDLTP